MAKHNGPADPRAAPATLAAYNRLHDLELDSFAGPEAQAAAQADDIAWCNHDIDDAVRAGLFDVDALAAAPLVGAAIEEVSARRPGLERGRLVHEVIRRLIDAMVNDLVGETRARARRLRPASAAAVRALGEPLVGFSDAMRAGVSELQAFLYERVYRHERVRRMAERAHRVVRDLFALFLAEPGRLPENWARPRGRPRRRRDGARCRRLRRRHDGSLRIGAARPVVRRHGGHPMNVFAHYRQRIDDALAALAKAARCRRASTPGACR